MEQASLERVRVSFTMLPTSKAALHKHRRVASARAVLSSQRLLVSCGAGHWSPGQHFLVVLQSAFPSAKYRVATVHLWEHDMSTECKGIASPATLRRQMQTTPQCAGRRPSLKLIFAHTQYHQSRLNLHQSPRYRHGADCRRTWKGLGSLHAPKLTPLRICLQGASCILDGG